VFGQETLIKTLLPLKQPSVKQGLSVEKKKLVTAVFISALLFSGVAGTQFVNLGTANPYQERGFVSPDASTKPPEVIVSSPLSDSAYTENPIPLSIKVTLPESSTALGTILYYVICQSDWQENVTYLYLNTGYANSVESQIPGPKHQYFQDLQNLTDIPDGNHSIIITAVAGGWYPADNMGFYRFMINGSSSVTFTIDTIPIISFLSFENKTFGTSNVPLNFTVNQFASKIKYSLNGQENVTITGNTTLAGLPNGDHNVAVYATDEGGNTGASETMYFNVNVPEPQPEPEPFPTTMVIAPTALVAVISAVLLVYFKKRKRAG
jgi:hypothetical protein